MRKLFTVILMFLLFSCSKEDNPVIVPIDDIANSTITYGMETLQELSKESPGENVIISPLSLSIPFYMLMNGAEGNTLEEIKNVLLVEDISLDGLNDMYPSLVATLTSAEQSELSLNNVVFYDPDRVSVNEDFRSILEGKYDCPFESLDFNLSSSVDDINNWAKDKTNNRIEKILEEIKQEEIMFLINALYFIADWKLGFDENLTNKSSFTLSDGTQIETNAMLSDEIRNYYVGEEYSAVDLVSKDEQYSVGFILPSGSPQDLLSGIVKENLGVWYRDVFNNLQEGRVMVGLPKFEISYSKEMSDVLKTLGMVDAFSQSNARLQGIGNAAGNNYISRVLHDTYLKIDEKGVEGAAVTTIGIGTTSAPPFINFDRPFILIIRHVETNIPIFLGIVENPS